MVTSPAMPPITTNQPAPAVQNFAPNIAITLDNIPHYNGRSKINNFMGIIKGTITVESDEESVSSVESEEFKKAEKILKELELEEKLREEREDTERKETKQIPEQKQTIDEESKEELKKPPPCLYISHY
ncbi:hypothetical protein JTB14_010643 [Gonioctena quinquepunctata]|nr:hypothetical protein JTB14_010643 [Gonioctena quinquepunctata]